eukprot:2625643-Rhodomonas_salina.1
MRCWNSKGKHYVDCDIMEPAMHQGRKMVLPISEPPLSKKQLERGERVNQTLLNLWCGALTLATLPEDSGDEMGESKLGECESGESLYPPLFCTGFGRKFIESLAVLSVKPRRASTRNSYPGTRVPAPKPAHSVIPQNSTKNTSTSQEWKSQHKYTNLNSNTLYQHP